MKPSSPCRLIVAGLVAVCVCAGGTATFAKSRGIGPHAVAVGEGATATAAEPLNPDAVAIIEDVDALLRPDKARSTFDRLSRLGAMAVPTIRQMMKRQNLRLVRAGLDLSERIGAGARDAQHELAAVVSDRQFGALRVRAARILGNLGNKASDALPQLMRSLDDPSARVREAVARACLDIASQGERWTPGLKHLLASRGKWREQAVKLLVTYGPLLHPAIPVLAKLAAQKPASAGEAASILVPQLIPGLGTLAKAAGTLAHLADGDGTGVGSGDTALDAATLKADEAASFEDIPAAE